MRLPNGEDSKRLMKAIFLDRDGVINELVYQEERGVLDSPLTTEQLKITPQAASAINMFHELGYKVILISNQPDVRPRGYLNEQSFVKIRDKMKAELAQERASITPPISESREILT